MSVPLHFDERICGAAAGTPIPKEISGPRAHPEGMDENSPTFQGWENNTLSIPSAPKGRLTANTSFSE
jgi:hypothetical protein